MGRRAIVVQRARCGLGEVAISESPHGHHLLHTVPARDGDVIPGADVAVRLGPMTVDVNLAALTGFLRFGTGVIQAGDVQPDVESELV